MIVSSVPMIKPGYRLQQEQESYVLLYPEGMVQLNESSSLILLQCDGKRSIAEIIAILEKMFESPEIKSDVIEFMEIAHARGWIKFI